MGAFLATATAVAQFQEVNYSISSFLFILLELFFVLGAPIDPVTLVTLFQ